MNKLKTLILFIAIAISSVSVSAEEILLPRNTDTSIGKVQLKQTNFSKNLKNTSTYNFYNQMSNESRSSSERAESSDNQGFDMMNMMMGGMMNTMNMMQGVSNSPIANQELRQQQLEYARQQSQR